VRSGDTLSSIATRYGLSVGELIALNDLRDRDVIRVGQRLVLSK
jgi:LysM repeat protein